MDLRAMHRALFVDDDAKDKAAAHERLAQNCVMAATGFGMSSTKSLQAASS